jgi:hypothetical protein
VTRLYCVSCGQRGYWDRTPSGRWEFRHGSHVQADHKAVPPAPSEAEQDRREAEQHQEYAVVHDGSHSYLGCAPCVRYEKDWKHSIAAGTPGIRAPRGVA